MVWPLLLLLLLLLLLQMVWPLLLLLLLLLRRGRCGVVQRLAESAAERRHLLHHTETLQ